MKKLNLNNKYICWGLTAFIVSICILGVYYLMFHGAKLLGNLSRLTNILMPVVFGLVIAYLLTPVLNYFEHRVFIPLFEKMNIKESRKRNHLIRSICILITTVLFFAIIYSLIYMLISEIVPSLDKIAKDFTSYEDNFKRWLNQFLENNPQWKDTVNQAVTTYSDDLYKWFNENVLAKASDITKVVFSGIWGVIKVLWNLILGLIISVYIMANKEKFTGQCKKILYAFFDTNNANIFLNNMKFTHNTFSGFISGKVLDSILIGCLCFMGTTLMHTPYAALISVIIGVTNFIPFFGPYLGAIPSAVLIFIVDPMHPLNVVYFAIFILILQQFDGNILGPKILGSSTGLTSFWVIFAITFFGGLWGVLGMVVGVPLFAVIYAAIRSIVNTKLHSKQLPTKSDLYTYVCAIDENGLHDFVPDHKLPKRQKSNLRYGQRFLSDHGQIIDGAYMKRENVPTKETATNENVQDEEKTNGNEKGTSKSRGGSKSKSGK